MRQVAVRLKDDYSYSKDLVYNNFPWPENSGKQYSRIVEAALIILRTREKYRNESLSDLYDPLVMPPDLLHAHNSLDKEIVRAYGFTWTTEEDCISFLMNLYVQKTSITDKI